MLSAVIIACTYVSMHSRADALVCSDARHIIIIIIIQFQTDLGSISSPPPQSYWRKSKVPPLILNFEKKAMGYNATNEEKMNSERALNLTSRSLLRNSTPMVWKDWESKRSVT